MEINFSRHYLYSDLHFWPSCTFLCPGVLFAQAAAGSALSGASGSSLSNKSRIVAPQQLQQQQQLNTPTSTSTSSNSLS